MYVCMHVCMYACMYVCMHACMYVCIWNIKHDLWANFTLIQFPSFPTSPALPTRHPLIFQEFARKDTFVFKELQKFGTSSSDVC